MKQDQRIYEGIPKGYPLCLHADCQMASSCLRHIAFRRCGELGKYLTLLNPCQCTKQEGCPNYASDKPIRFAKGFANFKQRMYPDQYDKFTRLLSCHFGRNRYYRLRGGTTIITPEEQEVIKIALEKVGINQEMDFDQYIEALNWTL